MTAELQAQTQCPACGYDLSGLPLLAGSVHCPECGALVPPVLPLAAPRPKAIDLVAAALLFGPTLLLVLVGIGLFERSFAPSLEGSLAPFLMILVLAIFPSASAALYRMDGEGQNELAKAKCLIQGFVAGLCLLVVGFVLLGLYFLVRYSVR